jgi:hypothetical protein
MLELIERTSAPEQFEKSLPKVVFGLGEEAPYRVSFDVEKYADFLEEFGLTEEKIRTHKLNLRRTNELYGDLNGFCNLETGETYLYCDNFWENFQKNKSRVEEIIKKRKKPRRNPFKDILYTRRLPKYLVTVEEERSLPFTRGLLLNGLNRNTNSCLLHEAKHFMEWSDDKLKREKFYKVGFLAGGAILPPLAVSVAMNIGQTEIRATDAPVFLSFLGMMSVVSSWLGVYYSNFFLPGERRAYKFKRNLKNDPKWRDIIKIEPKEGILDG